MVLNSTILILNPDKNDNLQIIQYSNNYDITEIISNKLDHLFCTNCTPHCLTNFYIGVDKCYYCGEKLKPRYPKYIKKK